MKAKRNDPCPCGSGKKYKKCHGAIELESKKVQRSYSVGESGQTGMAAFARKIIKVMESKPEALPPSDLPESKASTKEAETPELASPGSFEIKTK